MSGQYYKGTLLSSPIVRGSSGDTYGTHHSVLGIGGYIEVGTINDRNSIPIDTTNGIYFDGLSSGQRRLGMLVRVNQNKTTYCLQPKAAYSLWTGYTTSQKLHELSSNTNWIEYISSGGTSSTSDNISDNYYQLTHGFAVGNVIGYNGADFTKVNTTTALTIEPLGIVSKVIDANNFTLTYSGHILTSTIHDVSGHTLTGGTVYYLANVSGKITPIAPTGLTEFSKPMLVALASGATGVVLQYRGTSKTKAGVSYETFTGYTETTQIFLDKTVTGATNIGYFSGLTGKQVIDILTSTIGYNGLYASQYNYYYRDSNGIIRIGSPTYGGNLRRGYVSNFSPKKSWVYNTYTGTSNQIGWILVDGDISTNTGVFLTAGNSTANAGTPVYSEVEFSSTGGTMSDGYYTNSAVSLDVTGSFYTGTTYLTGGPVYSDKQYQELRFRTLVGNSPSTIKITHDNNFVYISGATAAVTSGATNGANVGTGVGVFRGKTASILDFKTLIGTGGTSVYAVGDNIYIDSSGNSGTYNLDSPSVLTVGGIAAGTTLTGKSAFQLFEDLLVPELFGTITPPSTSISLSASGLYEIGCALTQDVTGCFNRGCINPQYCSTSPKRSGCVNAYNFNGCGMVSGFMACTSSSGTESTPYTVVCGTQSWSVFSRYDAGNIALGSKGTLYCAALPSGCTSAASSSIVGTYPLYGTTVSISTLTKQPLQDVVLGNNIPMQLVADVSPIKQKFEIPCAWLSQPRPLIGVCQWNTVSNQWEYPGGSAGCSLNLWTKTGSTETVQGNSIGYCKYTYNGVDRSNVCIRLVF